MNHVGKVGIDNTNEWALTNYVVFLQEFESWKAEFEENEGCSFVKVTGDFTF